MGAWIDPRGVKSIRSYIQREQKRLRVYLDERVTLNNFTRRTAKYRARYDELGRMVTLIDKMVRPAQELPPGLRGYRGNPTSPTSSKAGETR